MRRPTLILAFLLVLSACGDSDAVDPTTPTSEATTPSATTAATPTEAPTTTAPEPATTTTTAPTSTTDGAPTISSTTTTTTTVPTTLPLADIELRLVEVAGGFPQPVFVTSPPDDDRLFVVNQPGTIELLRDGTRIGTFLDIDDLVAFGGERGMFAMAFHPAFPADPRFYVHYSAVDGSGILAEYRVGENPDAADPESGRTLLRVPQPASNHNGGMIVFGPDGFLYMGLGDGGGAGDTYGNGQNTNSLLGSIIRIDIDGDFPYAIPPSNPFAAGGGAAEIWGYGLRNPWRFSFDEGLLYIGDVGQNAWEEISVIDYQVTGANFGWPITEGLHCFSQFNCDQDGLVSPVLEYPHGQGACSVTGGYVYRGGAIPELAGAYFYGDFCSGAIGSFRFDGEKITEARNWPELTAGGLTSFGLDAAGELYVVTAGGTVYRIEQA